MKKNKMMRLASFLLVAVLLTTSVVSGTYAKYVTTGSADDTARVAKWGVTITVTGDDAFATMYKAGDTVATDAEADASVVSSVTTQKVVAPGTSGSFGSVTITGTPEVDASVEVVTTLVLGDGWLVDNDKDPETDDPVFYCPLVIGTVDGTNYKGNKDGFIAAVVAQFNEAEVVQANAGLDTKFNSGNIGWSWSFNGDDVYDTDLGNAAADGANLSIEFSISATVTQVD